MSKLTIYRGDTSDLYVTVVDGNGDPLDITTGTLLFTAKSNYRQSDDDDATIKKSSENGGGISLSGGENGHATVTIEPSDTENIYAPTEYVWDLQYVAVTDVVTTLAEGTLVIKPDVTRRVSNNA